MTDQLFPNFLTDAEQYRAAESCWREAWDDVLKQLRKTDHNTADWETPWLTTHFANGAAIGAGDPIFSAVNRRLSRGVRIVQMAASDDAGCEFFWFEDLFGDEDMRIRMLAIFCLLSNKTRCYAVCAMLAWILRMLPHEGRMLSE